LATAQTALDSFLASQKMLKAKVIPVRDELFKATYLITFQQPLDHEHPELGTFEQRVWLSHFSETAPVVLVTEGYSASRNYTTELARIVGANQIIVEHRYFENSTPSPKNYKYLTVAQAAADHHAIVEVFKAFYKSKWINTGISKGGSTTLFHAALYPQDVDVSVPYVAPLNFDREDRRLFDFFHLVGSEDDRKKLFDFQKLVLTKRDVLMPLLAKYVSSNRLSFDMGLDKAFELAVLEYPFAFMQWGKPISTIPAATATPQVLLAHLIDGSDISYFSDNSRKSLSSFFYQAYTELGYYAYAPNELKPFMKAIQQDTISSSLMIAGGDTLTFHREVMLDISKRLHAQNPKMIVITGENDPWGSTAFQAADLSNVHLFVKAEGSHLSRIANQTPSDRKKIYDLLEKWLGVALRNKE
jgi:hypothetical protein